MKKLLLVVVIAAFAIQSNAQSLADFKFGVKGGMNISNLHGNDDGDKQVGFNLGVVADLMLNEHFSFQPEVLYSSQGSDVSFSNIDNEIQLDYITVPMMFKYYVNPAFTLQAGPQIAFLVNDDVEFDNAETKELYDTEFKTIDFGLNIGLGYKFQNNLFLDARYNLGLTEVFDKADFDSKNEAFQLSIGYMF